MAITKKLIVTLKDDIATPSEKVYIYRGDIGVDIIIELENFNYRIDSISKKNMINRIEAYFKTPQGAVRKYNDEVDIINGDKIKFSFNKKVIDDMQLIGQYELQFHLFDKENNRITIPSYFFYVKEPLHENTSDEGAVVGYAVVDYSKVQDDDVVLFAVDENGYIKTDWKTGDIITASKLNKIETQLGLNTNKLNELEPYDDTELNNSLNNLRDAINNLNIPTKTSELENDSNFATEEFVTTKISEASLSGGGSNIDLSEYQTIIDNTLNTEDKTISGSINEIKAEVDSIRVPTKTSDLINDSNFTTNDYVNGMLGGKKLVYLTQLEYDSLSDVERNDGNTVYNITDININYVTEEELNNKEYATQTYVSAKIAEAQLGGGGGEVDLSAYATLEQVDEKVSRFNTLETNMTVINSIGGISAGTDLNGMTTLEILNKLIFPYVAPTYNVVGTPNGGIYEKGNNQTITNVRVTVTKKSEKITRIEVFDGSTSLGYLEGIDIENGGTFNFNVNVAVNSINKRLTATITDASNNSYSAKTGSFNFIYPYYIGVCEVNDEITETLIKGLAKRIETKGSKSISYTTNNQKMVFAYPSSYGNITKILDPNNFDVTNTFNKTAIRIIGLDGTAQNYNVYINSA